MIDNNPELSIILPCLNEELALGFCLETIKKVVEKNNLNAEIIVVDNGSGDKSCQIALEKGAKLVQEKERGYGCAYLKGFLTAQGKYLFFADSDGSYDFHEIPRFIDELKKGYNFVIGNRFKGRIEKGAMPWLHKYIGSPLFSCVLSTIFQAKIQDVHCGMRAVTKEALEKLNLKTKGMEFASEMVIKAIENKLKIMELPINYYKRRGKSKLHSIADGWRHLRFMLLYSPLSLFFLPGLVLFFIGLASLLWLHFRFYTYPVFLSALLMITGYQLIIFSIFAKTYAVAHLASKPIFNKLYKYITIETASIMGIIIVVLGIVIYGSKNSILALAIVTIGIQTVFFSFILSILGIRQK